MSITGFPKKSAPNISSVELPISPPKLRRQNAELGTESKVSLEEVKEQKVEVPNDLTDGVKNPTCFITNFPLDYLDLNVKGMEPCFEYGQGFVNRSPEDLLKLDYYNIWINCEERDERKWFNKNVVALKNAGFKLICLWTGRGVEDSHWLESMKRIGCHLICKLSKFKKVLDGSISADQLFDELQNLAYEVDAPPLTLCCGLISIFRKKKAEEESSK